MFNLEEELKKLPEKPGVYIMLDKKGEIIYVGKAKSLKNRVRSYFQSTKGNHPKVNAMIRNIHEFEYIIVDNEVESLILESNLIKKNRPKYNILLRDDKQYPYIKVTLNEKYPRVIKTRQVLKDGAKYFGPYPSAYAVNDVIEIIRNIYPIRTCKLNLNKSMGKVRPCLNYHMGRCLGPCIGDVDEDLYMGMIDEIIQYLSGKDDMLINIVEEKMQEASKAMEFERAARYRDQVNSLMLLQEKQKMVNTNMIDQDIIAMAKGLEEVCVQIFFVRSGKIIGREHFLLEDNFNEDRKEIVGSFIKQFYSGSAYIPREILIEDNIEDLELIEEWLGNRKGSKVSILIPQRGEKAELVKMVRKNARDMLNKYGDKFLKKHRENIKALEEIQHLIGLDELPNRIEAYDISNISGVQSVGSMVVFEKGEAKKSDYRRFRIRSVTSPDDYASMEEVLNRRFMRGLKEQKPIKGKSINLKGFSSFPDLIMIDGGKGQVNVVSEVLVSLGINIPVCGLVKDDFHKTRGILYNNVEYLQPKDSLGFRMINRIQDEAHRFALNYHRSLRSKDMVKSQLDDIKGIGEKRRIALMKHFKSIDKIKNATIEELVEVDTMNKSVAKNLFNHFNKKKGDDI